jgi:hypothetical protein
MTERFAKEKIKEFLKKIYSNQRLTAEEKDVFARCVAVYPEVFLKLTRKK